MVEFTAFQYRIATRRLPVKGTSQHFREGVLLRSSTDPSNWSEASPLPGLSPETIERVIGSLNSPHQDTPSLAFAIDSLKSELPTSGQVPVCALVADSDSQSFSRHVERLGDSPVLAVKLKVGRLPMDDDISRVHALHASLRADQTIRLDANRSWNLDEAVRFARATAKCEVEFIEEPIVEPNDLEQFYADTGCRYALDETLTEDAFVIRNFPNASALVIKPTVLGHHARIQELTKSGKKVVFSSVFETGVGIYQIGRIASALSAETAVGLDTYRWLKDDVILKRWNMEDGYFSFRGPPEVDESRLTPIA